MNKGDKIQEAQSHLKKREHYKPTNDMRMYFDTCIALVMTRSAVTVLMQEGINNGRIIALTIIIRALGFKSFYDTVRGADSQDIELLAAALYTFYRVSCSVGQVKMVLANRTSAKWLIKRAKYVLSCFGIRLENGGDAMGYIGDFKYVLCGEITHLRIDMFEKRFVPAVKGGNMHDDNEPIPIIKISAEKMEELMAATRGPWETVSLFPRDLQCSPQGEYKIAAVWKCTI